MSDLLVNVVRVDEVLLHPNADKLDLVKFGGWQIVSGKGNYKVGDLAIHIPPECLVPKEWADKWGVTQYLSWRINTEKGRVKAVKLRGLPSFGFLAPNETGAEIGTNLADHYGIEKYEEPIRIGSEPGQVAKQHPFFHKYTDIQNIRNYPNKLDYNGPLIVTEKIHGTNVRFGWVASTKEDGTTFLEKVVGSHRVQRKIEEPGVYGLPFETHGVDIENAKNEIIKTINSEKIDSIIFFGEIIGPGVQDLTYGLNGKSWALFDIFINGTYLPWNYVKEIAKLYNLPLVPYMNPAMYSFDDLCALAEGKSMLYPDQIKEGLVVRPMMEQQWKQGEKDLNPKRVIFKVINSEYLCRKNGTEKH